MILQSLTGYYQRLSEESDIASQGFQSVGIPFLIILNGKGEFVGLQDTRVQQGKKLIAGSFLVPAEKGRSGSKAWQTANLLWDHYGYVLGWPKSDSEAHKEMARKQHSAFVAEVKSLHDRFPDDKEIEAVHQFMVEEDFAAVFSDPSWPECAKIPGCNLSFRMEDNLRLVCENENVRAYVASSSASTSNDEDDSPELLSSEGFCLISGEYGPIARLHPRTPIPGAKSNAKIVAFQKNMGFDSYGKEQSYNAPTSEKAAFAYTTALNHMLAKDSRQRIQVGDATTVFWAEKRHEFESAFADIFGEPAKGEPEQDYKSLIAMFRSPETGARAELDPATKFFVLGLAPNAARIAVRFWYAGTVGDIVKNIGQHFDDLEMDKGSKEWRKITLKSLLRSTAFDEKDDRIAPNLAGDTMKSILTGIPYPRTLLASVISRIKAEQSRKDSKGKSVQNVNYTRAALIKAVLARETRLRENKRTEKEVGMSLDTANTNPGYLLGRLFAVLEKVQAESAGGWGKINTTIRDRFYGAASSTPVTAFPYLMKLKNHHLSKLEKHKGYYEGLIGEIIDKLDIEEGFPTHLSLQDQGRFAIGYYHQRYAK